MDNYIKKKSEIKDKKVKIVSVRLSLNEEKIILEKANLTNKDISAFMRNASLNQKVLTRFTDEDRNHTRQLIGMANNLNQLAKNSHQQNMLSLAKAIIETLDKINKLLNQFKN